jgi:hypothetical protein
MPLIVMWIEPSGSRQHPISGSTAFPFALPLMLGPRATGLRIQIISCLVAGNLIRSTELMSGTHRDKNFHLTRTSTY